MINRNTPISYEIDRTWRGDGPQRKGLIDLIFFLKKEGVKRVVEIGSFLGDSTCLFADNFEIVCSIDPYIPNYDKKDRAASMFNMFDVECNFLQRTSNFNNIVKMRMTDKEALHIFEDNSIEAVYLDHNHTYDATKASLIEWVKKIKSQGFISGHDYDSPRHTGVKKAVNEVLGIPDMLFQDGSWVKKVHIGI